MNLLGAHQRKEYGLPNPEPGERDQQPVDTHPHTAERRHSVLHGPQKVLVNRDGKKYLELTVEEVKYLEKIDDPEFTKE